ncbi:MULTISPECIES: hypothetical protein [Sinorhizobium]|uniref:hypothetical protein n=1 Tax=Sinorhizobium TaxID=28105 RepID=UPI000CD3EE3F|nr:MULTISPECIES: hypothetical protein [Sinorhizobium]
MTKRASIKQADLNRLAAVAKRNNITVEVEAEGYTIRLNPSPTTPTSGVSSDKNLEPEEFTSFAQWEAWRDRERAREAQRNS